MIKIYHNPRCKKSREGLEILEESGQKFKIVEYLKTTLSFNELKSIINLLDITPIELIRKNEAIWKDHYKGKILDDDEIIYLMIEYPKLIERPIVINKQKAIIGRPPENIKQVL
tara:strand:- start:8046 stop:8387 length:342 start_codon:yes stop_codon:yes gene_type:complete